jgi:hypothetical protein
MLNQAPSISIGPVTQAGNHIISFMRRFIETQVQRLRKQYFYIFPSTVLLPVQQKRIAIIQARLHVLMWVMAIGILAWSILESLVFSHDLWLSLLRARMMASTALIGFLFFGDRIFPRSIGKLWRIYFQLGVIFVIPLCWPRNLRH